MKKTVIADSAIIFDRETLRDVILEREIGRTIELEIKKKRTTDYDEIKEKDPPINGVWIFLNSGHCLFYYTAPSIKKNVDEHLVTSFLSSMDSFFNELEGDRCNMVFGYRSAYYYNYMGLHVKDREETIYLICVIGTKIDRGFSLHDFLSCDILSLKSGNILVSFFTKYQDKISRFDGNIDFFSDFHVECSKILRS